MRAEITDWLISQWTTRFSEIMMTMGDVQPKMQAAPIEESALKGGLLWWEQPFSCAPDSPIWVGASEQSWTEIGNVVLEAAGVESGASSEIQSTYLEIVRQSMGSIAQDIGARISDEVTSSKGAETPPRKIGRRSFQIDTELPKSTLILYLVVADDLSRSIDIAEKRQEEQAARPPVEVAAIPLDGTLGSRTFELLLDVELPVSVSFGRATIKLQEATKLITGSMIELDRGLNDPVELLVNNCVIARGEVVVIDGNYGVRITEIVSQKERLQQTRRYMLQ